MRHLTDKSIILILALATTVGCATSLTTQASRIKISEISEVKNCRLLGEITGSSQQGGLLMQESGKQNAKNEALNQAGNMQATNVVFDQAEGGFMGGHAHGRAYKCN